MDWLWILISFFGDLPFWIFLSALFFCIYLYSKKLAGRFHWIYTYVFPSVSVSAAVAYVMKIMLREPRICQGLYFCPSSYGFPSMHSAVAFAFTVAAIIYFRHDIQKNLRILILVMISIVFSYLIAYSRIAMGVHTIDEVIAGSLVGIILSCAWCLVYERYGSKKTRHKPRIKSAL